MRSFYFRKIVQKQSDKYIEDPSNPNIVASKFTKNAKVKKTFAVLAWITLSILLLFGIALGVLHSKKVQTRIIGRVTERLEQMLQADVRIAQFHYRPLSHLAIDSIYLSDQQRDTLAFIDQMQVEFSPLQLRHNRLDIQQILLSNPYVNIQSSSDSTLNIQFLIDLFKSDSDSFPLRVNIDTLKLEHTRFRYNELLVDQLNLDLGLPIFSKDSLDLQVNSLHLRARLDRLDASFEADLNGSLDSVFAQNMKLAFKNQTLFLGDIDVFHPTKLEAMYVKARCNDIYCSYTLLQDILSQLQEQPAQLPEILKQLGYVRYRGDFQGRLENLKLQGTFSTAHGALNVAGNVKGDTTLQNFDFQGHLSTTSFQLGNFLAQTDLGAIALKADLKGRIDANQLAYCTVKSDIQNFEYKGYQYQHILFDGEMRHEEINGKITIEDENLRLNINGLADWSEEDTRLDLVMKLADFNPNMLHLITEYPNLSLGATTYISLYTSGTPSELLDNMTGYVIVDSLLINNGDKHTTMEQFKLLFDTENIGEVPTHRLRLQSDYVTANLNGAFQYRTMPRTIQGLLHNYLPSIVKQPATTNHSNNMVDFYAYFRNLDSITQVLDLGVELPYFPTIKGYIREQNRQVGLQAFIPQINTGKVRMQDITVSLDNQDDQLGLSVFVYNHLPKDNPTAAKVGDIKANLHLNVKNDELDLKVELGNTDQVRNEGIIHAKSKLALYNDKPAFDIQVQPSHIILNDSAWNISQTNINYVLANKTMDICNLKLNTDYQSITIDGRASESATDSLNVTLENINLDYLLSYTEASKAISILGPVTGHAILYSVFSAPMLEANARIPNGGLNGVYLGDVIAEATLDRENKTMLIYGQIVDSTKHTVAVVNGKVIPSQNKWWGLDITCNGVNINFIDFWTNKIIANPQGKAYGNIKVEGEDRLVWVTGRALAQDAHITLPQIGVTMYMTDSIFLDSTAVRFPDIAVYDAYGNTGLFTGVLHHENFLNMRYDLRARANKMMVMNLPADQQSFFYGQIFATGDVHIHGNEMDCQIDANVKTEANTKFHLNINSTSQASNSSFINFVQPDTASHYLLELLQPKATKTTTIARPVSRTRLSLQGEITPDAEINISLGGESGIKGRGEGNLKLVYENPSNDVQMQGSYTLQSGKFDFSLANIVRRNFTIREGSKITWDSDPLAPTIDITGYYHTTASLRDLFGSESSQVATNRTSIPVNCVLHMTDQLFNPILHFAIELPQSDESVQSQVNSIINTDEMLMRQVIYLLVFNRFYTADYLQNTQNVGLNETYSILSSTITGQINSWLSKLTDVFTMGFNFRTDGEGETASQEYEANFQIHPINQLIINGNFGYRYNDLSNRPFFGDLDIEYLLTENGKLRAKAFTHTVDKYSLRQANTVQGVGFIFKHDFNWSNKPKKDNAKQKEASDKSEKTKKDKKDKNNKVEQ